jgi:hypothetical protein
VEALERYADRVASEDEFAEARAAFQMAEMRRDEDRSDAGGPDEPAREAAVHAVGSALNILVAQGAEDCLGWVAEFVSRSAPGGERTPRWEEVRRRMCDLLREVVGNPFRPWQAVLGGGFVQPDGLIVRTTDAVRRLADGVHADRAFDRLPILADALEESGATDSELLAHCRQPGGHVRGCWALDVALGRT